MALTLHGEREEKRRCHAMFSIHTVFFFFPPRGAAGDGGDGKANSLALFIYVSFLLTLIKRIFKPDGTGASWQVPSPLPKS
jgi:hypothetical protein